MKQLALLLALVLLAPAAASAEPPLPAVTPVDYHAQIVKPHRGRVVLVNFWATWCEPCREEMPALQRAVKQFGAREVTVVLISLDSAKAAAADVPRFLEATFGKGKVPWKTWLVKSEDPQTFIDGIDKKWDGTLPFTAIYDKRGNLAERLQGKQSEAAFAAGIRKAR